MAPAAEQVISSSKRKRFSEPEPGEEVYITGIAGSYPDCHSVHELQEKLFNKVDLVTDDYRRWKRYESDIPQRSGKLYDLEMFDASFFNIDYTRANVMDPGARVLHEKVFEAIVDAGYSPSELRNQKVGVFLGAAHSETEYKSNEILEQLHPYGAVCCSRSSFANNISQWLGVSGPSYALDTACSSSAYAIEHAYRALRDGRCDVAITGCVQLCLSAFVSMDFFHLGVLSRDGKCKCFDQKADGYARSEAVAVVLLQRAKHARRVYAEVIHSKTNCDGYKELGITYPAGKIQTKLLQNFYQECGVRPTEIEFLEAHATGTQVGDPEELNAIDNVFCKDRSGPLMIGSNKSNMGHTEAGSGICALSKLVIAYNSGYMPPNINFEKYREGVAGFAEGRMVVVTEKKPWSRGFAACNSFGFGGANAHTLLKNVARDKVNNGLPSDNLPRLVCVSGRTELAVAKVLDHLCSKTVDVDEVRLWHSVFGNDIYGHPFRGYILLGSTPTKSIQLARDIRYYRNTGRKVWLVYPGLETEWSGSGHASLMKLPAFAAAVEKCQKVLEDVDLMKLLSNLPVVALSNVLDNVVAVTALQIGLSDVLKTVSVKHDHILGYGIGQLGSLYMCGNLTAEQAIQAAYHVGKTLDKTGHLASTSAPSLLKNLEHVITSPILRQSLVNLLQNQEPLNDAVKKIPSDVLVVEVTVDAQLKEKQHHFRKVSLGRKNEDGLRFFLVALGKLYEEGLNPILANLYPHIQFPVAQGTSMLSHLIGWKHKEIWPTNLDIDKKADGLLRVNLDNDDQRYLEGHIIDGRTLYPATGYLELVWQTFAGLHKQLHTKMSVVFENVSLHRATTLPKNGSVDFVVTIHKKTGNFEVLEGDTTVATGKVYAKKNVGTDNCVIVDTAVADNQDLNIKLTSRDFYKELHLRGYQYKGSFRGVLDCDVRGTSGHIEWRDNWVPFLDAMLQPLIITQDTRALYVPTRIEKISIDVDIHYDMLKKIKGDVKAFKFQSFPQIQVSRLSGVELRGLHVTAIISKKPPLGIPVYEKNEFIPNYVHSKMDINDILRLDLQLVLENVHTYKFKVIELVDQEYKENGIAPIIEAIGDVLADLPLIQAELLVLSEEKMEFPPNVKVESQNISSESNVVVFIGANLLERPDVLAEAMKTLKEGCFVMSRETTPAKPLNYSESDYNITTTHNTGFENIVLIRKKTKSKQAKFFHLVSGDETFSWVEKLIKEMKDNTQKLVIYCQNESVNGLLGMVNCLRKEPGGESVYGLLIADPNAPSFDPKSDFIKQQMKIDLAMNVYKNGAWGTYRHFLLDEPEPIDASHAYVNVTTVGDLSSLRWLQGPLKPDQTFKQNSVKLVHVYCSALNFHDVMAASGRVPVDALAQGRLAQECVQGIEVSGRTLNGSRVMAVTDKGICNLARCEASLMCCIPDEWTFEEAVTVPVAYMTVYMALVLIGKIKRGESILIHAGSGGVGQAAISVALYHGLEVFTTVGTPDKRQFIKRLFPQLKDSHIGNSRDISFEDMIRRETNGNGVHVVLNSLADDKLLASVKCLTRRGRFLEIGKYDIMNNTNIETCLFRNEVSFHGVMLDFIGDVQSETLRQNLQKLLMAGIVSGAVRPLTNCIFSKDEIESSYRFMAAGKHIGKISKSMPTNLDIDKKADGLLRVNLDNDDQRYLEGHIIDGRTLYPATGYLELVWQTFAGLHKQLHTKMSVVFENVSLHRATTLPKNGSVDFVVTIHKKTGNFEVLEGDTTVATGKVYAKKNVGTDNCVIVDTAVADNQDLNIKLTSRDFYKELHLRGYQYKGSFRGVLDCDVRGTSGHIEWRDNWVPFLDAMLQPLIITQDTRALYVPTRIEKISIDVDIHYDMLKKIKGDVKAFKFQSFPQIQVSRLSGVELRGLHVTAIISKKPPLGIPVYEKNEFIPNYVHSKMDINDILRLDLQLVLENVHTYKFKVIELVDQEYKENGIAPIIEAIGDVLADLPLIQAELLVLSEEKMEFPPNVKVESQNISSESNVVVFIGANLLERPDVLAEAMKTLKEGCFVMSRETTPAKPLNYSESDYNITTTHNTGFENIVLIRKKTKSKQAKFFHLVSGDETFSWVEKLIKEMKDNTQKLVIYCQNESVNGLLGMVNCLRKEPGGESVYGLLIADPNAPSFDPKSDFIKQQMKIDLAMNVYKNGAWGTYRHFLLDEPEPIDASHAYVNVTTVGDLSSLRWLQGPLKPDQTFKQNSVKLVHVYCSALNFHDVMAASGRVPVDALAQGRLAQECVQGIEVSGRTLNGSRVMAVTDKGICNLARCEASLMCCIPDEWTFEEAVTVPVAYMTVYMALVLIGKIKRGESILIHAGSGGVGQAAISVALYHGLEVFTTVGTPDKRQFIKRLFPQLKDSHIGNSRDISFEDMIRRETNGNGVHVVLNSLADDKLLASVKCLTRRGRFLEIGKYDIMNNTNIETCLFRNEVSFHGVMLDFIGDVQSETLRQNLQKLLMAGIVSGAVRPLTNCIFSKDEIESSYRFMAAGKHIGKVIINIRDEEPKSSRLVRPVAASIKAIPRYTCDENHVYVLIGGLGGFGLELSDWLVLRGARKLVLCSRRGVSNGYQALRIRFWKAYGVEVQISTDDITTESGCETMLKRAKTLGIVVAVFNLAVVLRDAVFQNQTQDTFKESYGPKSSATIHLDKLTRTLCPELKDFVIFSSVSCGRGNAGQTNYGFSNSVMERICEIRKNEGLPALAIQWGAIGDVGLVADMQEENIQLEIGGTLQQRIVSCLQAMDMFLKQDAAIVSSIVVAEKRSGGDNSGSSVDAVAAIMGFKDLKKVSYQVSLAELGMDSIMAVEIKQILERDYELFLSAQEIRNLSFAKLAEYSNKKESDVDPSKTKEVEAGYKSNRITLLVKNLGDEKQATESSIWLPTLVSNNKKGNTETLFMMPGIENCATALTTLCSRLDSRACVLQLGLKHNDEGLDKMADRMYPIIKSQLAPGEQFFILGFSFGTLVMLRIAAMLEKDGHSGHVICLDGSPEYLHNLAKSVMGDALTTAIDDTTYLNGALQKIATFLYPNNKYLSLFTELIQKHHTLEEKINAFISMLRNFDEDTRTLKFSEEYKASIISALYHRIKVMLDVYKNMDVRLKAPITLIRSKSLPDNVECSEDYGLSAFSERPVLVHYVDESHTGIVDNEESAAIVNKVVGDARVANVPDKMRTGVVKNFIEPTTRTVEL